MLHPNKITTPINPWHIEERGFSPGDLEEKESLFALGNGYIGLRGNLEEWEAADAPSINGAYINGLFESAPIQYGEAAYGYAKNRETICRVADAKQMALAADGEPLMLGRSDIRAHLRRLDMKNGVLERRFFWHTASGCVLKVTMERLVSLERQYIAAARCRVTAISGQCVLSIASGIRQVPQSPANPEDPRTAKDCDPLLLLNAQVDTDGLFTVLEGTRLSRKSVACAALHQTDPGLPCVARERGDRSLLGHWSATLCEGERLSFEKYIAYAAGTAELEKVWLEKAKAQARQARSAGFHTLLQEQRAYLSDFWNRADVEIEGDDAILQGLRFHLFHLLQSCGRDGNTNIAAKGLTGQGYEGHTFWDTEAYMFPFFLYTQPETARKLLEYRYSMLDKARLRARVMGHRKGALFPWRTIDGEECSAYYPAGTAQYHINADIAYAVSAYLTVTEDMEFMERYGTELLIETARFWLELGFYNQEKHGAFCIQTVTGPDEYNVLVDNNVYTNLMAKHNLLAAANAMEQLNDRTPQRYHALCKATGIDTQEPEQWRRAARAMYLPFDEHTLRIPQDDSFFSRQPWALAQIPKENFPLLLHYHPLVIYRHQVCKQADLIFAMVQLGSSFTMEQKKENFWFYDGITTHDSSLSMAVFGILASEIGESGKAYQYFEATARLDLDNIHQNTRDGLHMANMAGTWLSLVQGFGGLRLTQGKLCLAPSLPACWNAYRFRLCFQGSRLLVEVQGGGVTVTLVSGEPLTLWLYGKEQRLQTTLTTSLEKQEEGLE